MRIVKVAAAVALGMVAPVGLVSAQVVLAPGAALRSEGTWQPTNESAASGMRRWSLDVRRGADNSLVGTVRVTGSPLLEQGKVVGRLVGTAVTGRILDERGEVAATFTGEVRTDGTMHGVYVDRTGERGRWWWAGQP
jgi:hypothetical protein